MDIDLSLAIDNFCPKCNKKKIKYLGKLLGNSCVLYRPDCSCESSIDIKKHGLSDKAVIDSLHIPFWQLMGQKAKPKDIAYEKYLKSKNMTYGDAYLERNYREARNPSALQQLQKHIK